jgi:hypothetical protein
VDVGLILFGENPEVIEPVTMQLLNHEKVRPSINKFGVVEAYAANTN